jgi:DNA-binding GntR family transcriptional regulator
LASLGNPKLLEMVGALRDQSRLFGLDAAAGTAHFKESTKEHAQLLDAIEAQDSERAASVMSMHLHHVRGLWAGQDERP